MIRPVHSVDPRGLTAPVRPSTQSAPAKTSFAETLESRLRDPEPVRFSAHARERLDSRNVTFSGSDRLRLDRAVDRLAEKGSRESLVLMDELALVVSVPNRTVITVVPQSDTGNIFTHIDSAVVVPKDGTPREG